MRALGVAHIVEASVALIGGLVFKPRMLMLSGEDSPSLLCFNRTVQDVYHTSKDSNVWGKRPCKFSAFQNSSTLS